MIGSNRRRRATDVSAAGSVIARLVARRLLIAVPILFAVLTIDFFLIELAPGDPLPSIEDQADGGADLSAVYDLDRPLLERYAGWLRGIATSFDLGWSFLWHEPVTRVLAETLPNTLLLTGTAFVLEIALGIGLGLIAALRRGTFVDGAIRVGSLALYSTPSFYLGLVLLFVFAGGVFQILPAGGMESARRVEPLAGTGVLVERLRYLILPVLTLTLGAAAAWARFVRGEVLDVIRQDWVLAARARGLRERRVLFVHVLRAALLPIVTLLGLSLPYLIGGAVIVENVFSWPGLGQLAVRSVLARDRELFLGISLLLAVLVLLGNLFADILYLALDPRTRRAA